MQIGVLTALARVFQSSPDAVVGRYRRCGRILPPTGGFNPRPTRWSGAMVHLIKPEITAC